MHMHYLTPFISPVFANVGKFGKAIAHGLSRAAIAVAQGGKALGGFLSGFAGKLLGGIAAGMDNISKTTRTILISVAGGTASVLGGGKFANGALSSAFIFMFNDMADYRLRQKRGRVLISDNMHDKAAIDNGLSREEARVKAAKAYGTIGLGALSAPVVLEGGGAYVSGVASELGTIEGFVDFVSSYLPATAPAPTFAGSAGFGVSQIVEVLSNDN